MKQSVRYLLLFSLGPVQSFIAQARKTRDLWSGSFLLSLLMEASMQGIERSALIFPAEPTIDSLTRTIPDLPNKYVACFSTFQTAQATALRSTKQIEERWLSVCADVWQKNIRPFTGADTRTIRTIWERQIRPATLFEIFWVIVERQTQDYPTWLWQAQEALSARKRSRTLKWYSELDLLNEPGEKSTISGEREALHTQNASREAVSSFWQTLATAFPHDLMPDGAERLDAIDTVKRFAFHTSIMTEKNIASSFPSTSSIATASYVKQLLCNPFAQREVQDWLYATRDPLNKTDINTIPLLQHLLANDKTKQALLQRDGDCFFPETFTAYRLKKDYAITSNAQAAQRATSGGKALKQLLLASDRAGITRPTPYYAMILMDGDKMGPLVGGVTDVEEHNAISRAVSTFSRKQAPMLIHERYPARLIYAGGDDTFALAPLTNDYTQNELLVLEQAGQQPIKTVLALVDQLQRAYCSEVRAVVHGEERQKSVTTSIGIAIAHHYTSLSSVRRIAREAEELAKKQYGRNALVITVLRRSGEQTRVGCHWEYHITHNGETRILQPFSLFSEFYALFTQEILSSHYVYMLLEEAPTLITLELKAQQSEIIRILQRQQRPDARLSLPQMRSLAKQITDLAYAMDNDEETSSNGVGASPGVRPFPNTQCSMETGHTPSDAPTPLQQPTNQTHFSVELHSEERRYGLLEIIGWLQVLLFLARKDYA